MGTIPVVKLSMVREATLEYPKAINQREIVAEVVRSLTLNDADESFFVLALDVKNRINHIYNVAKGGGESVGFLPKDLFRTAILANASAIIIAHNHPSGDTSPSNEDLAITKRIKECSTILGLRFLDSIIVTADSFRAIEL